MNKDQLERLEKLRTKANLTKKEWEEYEDLVRMQYKTGDNDPKSDVEEKPEDEQPN